MIISHCFTVMVSNQLAFRVPFFRFPNYLRMLCLKMAHLGRVAYCFEPMLFRHANLYFSTIISMRKQKRFVSKQGQPRPRTQLKARVLITRSIITASNSSSCYFDTVKDVFPSQIWAILLQPHLYSSSCFILYSLKQRKQINSREFEKKNEEMIVAVNAS